MPSRPFSTDNLAAFTAEALDAELYDSEQSKLGGDDFPLPNPPRSTAGASPAAQQDSAAESEPEVSEPDADVPADAQSDQSQPATAEATPEEFPFPERSADTNTVTDPLSERDAEHEQPEAAPAAQETAEEPVGPEPQEEPDFFEQSIETAPEPDTEAATQEPEPAPAPEIPEPDYFDAVAQDAADEPTPDLGAGRADATDPGQVRFGVPPLSPSQEPNAGESPAPEFGPDAEPDESFETNSDWSEGGVDHSQLQQMAEGIISPGMFRMQDALSGHMNDSISQHADLSRLATNF